MDESRSETDAERAAPLITPLAIGEQEAVSIETRDVVFDLRDIDVYYGSALALEGVTLEIYKNVITAMIGPSGCGKSTFVRSLNRMNDSIPGFRLTGQALYHGNDIYASSVDPVEVRRRIGMVFQKPNPFPKSIYDNVAWAPRILGMKEGLDERVEKALRRSTVGRGQGSPEAQRPRALRRTAAATVHRAFDRHRARRAATG